MNKDVNYLYIHWPFCKNKCHYCDFTAFEKHEKFMLEYHKALCNEVRTYVKGHNGRIKTIFFGGGTPSLYPLKLLEELFNILNESFDLSALEEVSLEANPGGVTEKHLATWKNLGINRLSIGVQVLADEVLANLNRFQTNKDVCELMELAPKYFDNLSADLILGLPGVSEDTWHSTLGQVVNFPIKHVSVYMLMIKEKTPLYFRIKNKEFGVIEDDTSSQLYDDTVRFLERHGFNQYEVSNFAKTGCASVHNKAYWEYEPYRGFGLGAASFDGERRFLNIKNLTNYLKVYSESREALQHQDVEQLSEQQVLMERLMLGLRQREGVGLHSMLYLFVEGEQERVLRQLELLEKEKLVTLQDGRVALTLKGMPLGNEIVLTLL